MVQLPAATPVTTPADVTVAMPVLFDVQGVPAGVPVPTSVIVAPTHTVVGPVTVGCAITVIVFVVSHPKLLV